MNPNADQDNLTCAQKLHIQSYVDSLLKTWLGWLGAANIIFLLSAFFYLIFVVPEKASKEASILLEGEIEVYTSKLGENLQDILVKFGEFQAHLDNLNTSYSEVTNEYNEFKQKVQDSSGTLNTVIEGDNFKAINALEQLNKYPDLQTLLNNLSVLEKSLQQLDKNIKSEVRNLQIEVKPVKGYVTGVAKENTNTFNFSFPVKHAWVEITDNISNADSAIITDISGKSVTVNTKMIGGGPGGAGIIRYRVWATSF